MTEKFNVKDEMERILESREMAVEEAYILLESLVFLHQSMATSARQKIKISIYIKALIRISNSLDEMELKA